MSFSFGSGFCALIYQTTWLREFRLITAREPSPGHSVPRRLLSVVEDVVTAEPVGELSLTSPVVESSRHQGSS